MELPTPHKLRDMFREAKTSRELILKGAGVWRPDYALEPLTDDIVHRIAKRVAQCSGLDIEDPELVLTAIDHGLVEPRPCALKKLWSDCIFPLTQRGFRAIMMVEQGPNTAQALHVLTDLSDTPDWPLERKNRALLEDYARWNWVEISNRKKRTYELIDAINNDILFFVDKRNEVLRMPDDDVVLFRLRYEPPKVHASAGPRP